MDYDAETDISPELGPELVSKYQSWIGVLRWMVELGRVDVITEASLLSSQLALPRESHLEALLHLFAHLGDKHNARLALDPTYPEIDQDHAFINCNWKNYYGNVEEAKPPNAPTPRGKDGDL